MTPYELAILSQNADCASFVHSIKPQPNQQNNESQQEPAGLIMSPTGNVDQVSFNPF